MSAGNVLGVKGAIFQTAVQTKLDQLHKTGVTAHIIWDALVFRKVHGRLLDAVLDWLTLLGFQIRAALGGNILLMVTSSTPISGEVVDFLKIAFGCGITEGATNLLLFLPSLIFVQENCGVCTRTSQGDPTGGRVIGLPQPILEVKLIDLPAMN
ncbi:hypothetical protein BKA82DRAFT_36010 [Pisolithus tinctorius]|nr:hypothetical protein BKA82DRAFT_36010 [Pisolithus tinctorius]